MLIRADDVWPGDVVKHSMVRGVFDACCVTDVRRGEGRYPVRLCFGHENADGVRGYWQLRRAELVRLIAVGRQWPRQQ